MGQLQVSRGQNTSKAALRTALPGCSPGTLLLGEASPAHAGWGLILLLWKGTVSLGPKNQLMQQQEEVYFVWKNRSPKQTAEHVKMLTVSVADYFCKNIA